MEPRGSEKKRYASSSKRLPFVAFRLLVALKLLSRSRICVLCRGMFSCRCHCILPLERPRAKCALDRLLAEAAPGEVGGGHRPGTAALDHPRCPLLLRGEAVDAAPRQLGLDPLA